MGVVGGSFKIFVGVVAVLVGLYANTLRPTGNVPREVIEADGGRALEVDGRVIEYFVVGDEQGIPVLLVHGGASTGKSGVGFGITAKRKGFKIISVSTPGYGATSPIVGRGYFEGAKDAIRVLQELGYGEDSTFHLMGISYGSGTAAAIAILVPDRIRSLHLVVPAWPSMGEHDIFASFPAFMKTLNSPFVNRIYYYYFASLIDFKSFLKSVAPEEAKMAEVDGPGFLDEFNKDYKRSSQYHLEGACELMTILSTKGQAIYEKIDILQGLGKKVHIWYGELDNIVLPAVPRYLVSLLPSAVVISEKKGHLGLLIDQSKFFDKMKTVDAASDTAVTDDPELLQPQKEVVEKKFVENPQ